MSEQINEDNAIRATVQSYIDSIKFTQPDWMLKVFHPQATMSVHTPQGFIIKGDLGKSFQKRLKDFPPTLETSPNFDGEILSVNQQGDMAAVWIAEKNLDGKNFNTFFHLHKVDGTWVITAKATRGVPVSS